MAVVSRPLKNVRRTLPPGGVWPALPAWLVLAAFYLLLLVLGYLLLTPVFTWGQRRLDDLRYGMPRTVQITGFVGHHEEGGAPTHLLAINLRRQISVIEFPGGDTTQPRMLAGPYLFGADGDTVVPQLSLEDMNDDGAVDLLVRLRDEILIYLNANGEFRLMTPAERAQLAAQARGP